MTDTESRREQQVLALFKGFGAGPEAVRAAIRELFADQCVWENGPIATTTGPDEAIALIQQYETDMGMHAIEFEVLNLAVRGDVVLAERLDHVRAADGTALATTAAVSVFEFDDDQLVAWREYFDPTPYIAS